MVNIPFVYEMSLLKMIILPFRVKKVCSEWCTKC